MQYLNFGEAEQRISKVCRFLKSRNITPDRPIMLLSGSSVSCASLAIESGRCDLALAVGFDKHPRCMFAMDPAMWNLPNWFGETGMCISTQFFAMKIKRYMHEYGITDDTIF